MRQKAIWVLPEIKNGPEEISKLSLGLLTEASYIAEKVGGSVTALIFSDQSRDFSEISGQYGVTRAHDLSEIFSQYGVTSTYIFKDPAFKYFSAEAYAAALVPIIKEKKPWFFLTGHTTSGGELFPRLAALLETGLVTNCTKMELSCPERPKFYRPVYGDQLYQEVIFQTEQTMLVTMDPRVLNIAPVSESGQVITQIIEPKLPPGILRARHLDYLPADFRTVDVTEADIIISAGMGAATDETLPLVEELATLMKGAVGTTRPVVDSGKIPRERLIGQTSKVVSPKFYLALGISGATHHVGGIQNSEKIVAINRDPQAPIFQNSDVGIIADVREVLPKLIERIRQTESHGQKL